MSGWKLAGRLLAVAVIVLAPLGGATAQTAPGASGKALTEEALDFQLGRNGRPKDETRARTLFEAAARAGDGRAMAWLGDYHRDGRGGLARSDAAALDWYRRGVAANDRSALVRLAEFNALGRGGLPRNRAEALRLYEQARSRKWPVFNSIHEVAKALEASAPLEALAWYSYGIEGAAGLGPQTLGAAYGRSMIDDAYRLVMKTSLGDRPTPGDAALVRALNATVARDGAEPPPRALILLGYFHGAGRGGLVANEAQAYRLFRRAADLGDPDGLYFTARMLSDGRGGQRADPAAAMGMLLGAAHVNRRGEFAADLYFQLAINYIEGRGARRNAAASWAWLERAKAMDNAEAATALSKLRTATGGGETGTCRVEGRYERVNETGQKTAGNLTYEASLLLVGTDIAVRLSSRESWATLALDPTGGRYDGRQLVVRLDGAILDHSAELDSSAVLRLSISTFRQPPGRPGVRFNYTGRGQCRLGPRM